MKTSKDKVIEEKRNLEGKPYIADFRKSNFNFAIVCRGSVEDIQKLKNKIIRMKGITPIYQKISNLPLRIMEGD